MNKNVFKKVNEIKEIKEIVDCFFANANADVEGEDNSIS